MGANYSKVKAALKLLGAASLAHFIYKMVAMYREKQRYMRLLGNVPGQKGFMGKELIRNFGRLHDYRVEYVQRYPQAPLLTTSGPGPSVIACDSASVKTILKDEFNICRKPTRKDDAMFWFMSQFIGGDGIFCLVHGKGLSASLDKEHKKWFDQRKTASVIFTKRKFETFMHETFVEKMESFIKVLDKHAKEGTHVDIQNLFFIFTMNSIQKLFFGRDINTLESGEDKIGIAFDEAHRLMLKMNGIALPAIFAAQQILPWPLGSIFKEQSSSLLVWFALFSSKHYWEFRKVTKDLHTEVNGIIRAARKDPMLSKRKDLLANFMNSTRMKLSTSYLRDLILNFIIAGRDTTACTLTWLFYELSINPEVQDKLYQELNAAFPGNRTPAYSELAPQNLPYLNGCIMETLRLHPPVPEEAKYATRDVPFPDGTVVPSGTRLIFLPYAMGRDPRRYPKPDKFNPNRWIPYTGYPDPYDFPVFQAGYRECLGKDMAMFEAKLVASMLLQRFSFTLQEGEKENITYSFMLTMSLCNSGPLEDLGDDRTHELWLKPTRRPTSA